MIKSLLITTLGLSSAGLVEMEASFKKIIADSNPKNTSLTEFVTKYGCWCSSVAYNHKTDPDRTSNLVLNEPVDELDNACKVLMDSYRRNVHWIE